MVWTQSSFMEHINNFLVMHGGIYVLVLGCVLKDVAKMLSYVPKCTFATKTVMIHNNSNLQIAKQTGSGD